jgi:hypothetical protein
MPSILHEILSKRQPYPEFTLYFWDLGIQSPAISGLGIQELKEEKNSVTPDSWCLGSN